MPVESTRSQNITVTCRRSPTASVTGAALAAAIDGAADVGAEAAVTLASALGVAEATLASSPMAARMIRR